MATREELYALGITALKEKAKSLGIKGYSAYRSANKNELADLILSASIPKAAASPPKKIAVKAKPAFSLEDGIRKMDIDIIKENVEYGETLDEEMMNVVDELLAIDLQDPQSKNVHDLGFFIKHGYSDIGFMAFSEILRDESPYPNYKLIKEYVDAGYPINLPFLLVYHQMTNDPEIVDPNETKIKALIKKATFLWPDTFDVELFSEIRPDLIELVLPSVNGIPLIPKHLKKQIYEAWPQLKKPNSLFTRAAVAAIDRGIKDRDAATITGISQLY